MHHGYRSCPDDLKPRSPTPHPAPFGVQVREPTWRLIYKNNHVIGQEPIPQKRGEK